MSAFQCECGLPLPVGFSAHVCPGDELNVPLTRRDALAMLAKLAERSDTPEMREAYGLVWEELTVAWRQP